MLMVVVLVQELRRGKGRGWKYFSEGGRGKRGGGGGKEPYPSKTLQAINKNFL